MKSPFYSTSRFPKTCVNTGHSASTCIKSTRISRTGIISAALLILCVSISSAGAQPSNPLGADARAASIGGVIFRAQCATCHGADAKGISSIETPDLTLLWTQAGISDGSVFESIKQGVPGSIMPAHGFPDTELWMLVSYLRSISVAGSSTPFTGDELNGRKLFNANCGQCHRVDGAGGSLGPSLTGITSRRSQELLSNSVRDSNALIARGYKPISFRNSENKLVQGVIKSEDAFSIQIMELNQKLSAFMKSDIAQINRDVSSVMPSFSVAELSDSELSDILSFLNTTR
ncbi:MAG: hypothetical protein COA96_02345 [SAR86 cluster bacterium]|uniref:Cytochrome c domain-containing protein n=1 Tax=SAR86 cluster bacterium TaxID=2030880 RepID=A0A2A5B958_9GAMM|nr:MAG: hypothetical protein COA96_02345 [SAR86 cluster bacterium]